MLTIDGSQGEGGGQILRTSLSLGALTGEVVRIHSIRAGRPKPGLAAQHVTCCRAVAQVCNGRIEGAKLDSTQVTLHPGETTGGRFEFDVAQVRPSAGSVSLVLQSILPILALAPETSEVTIRGGTDVKWSPPYSFMANTFSPAVARFGLKLDLQRPRAGFYPAGGGEIRASIQPAPEGLQPIEFTERGQLQGAVVASTVSDRLPEHILRRQNEAAAQKLADEGISARREEYYIPSTSPGTACVVSLEYDGAFAGFSALGEKGKPAEAVGKQAGEAAAGFVGDAGTVDAHLADQLLIYMALARGESRIRTRKITDHLRTSAQVARTLLNTAVSIDNDGTVTVSGSGLCRT